MSVAADLDFHCTACGKCCNSPPQLSLDELLRHQGLFIGALQLRVQPRWRVRQRVPTRGGHHHQLEAGEVAAAEALANEQGFDLGNGHVLQLSLQGLSAPSMTRCPALSDAGLCRLHAQGKPAMCINVPLDPGLPDGWQPLVLERRRRDGPEDLGADCLMAADALLDSPLDVLQAEATVMAAASASASASVPSSPRVPLLRGGRLARREDVEQLAVQRRDRLEDRRRWGEAVFRQLRREGVAARLPPGQALTLPLVPVLMALTAQADEASALIDDFLQAQIDLIERAVAAALERRQPQDRVFTHQLRHYLATYQRFQALAPAR